MSFDDESITVDLRLIKYPWICQNCNYKNEAYYIKCRMCNVYEPRVVRDYKYKQEVKAFLTSISIDCYKLYWDILIENGFDCWEAVSLITMKNLEELKVKPEWRVRIWNSVQREKKKRRRNK